MTFFKEPSAFERRVLLVVSGMSPQILTETLWALTQARESAFYPTEIKLLTTSGGARNARLHLIDKKHFVAFCQEYNFNYCNFEADHIDVIKNAAQQELEDIRTPSENESAADYITETIRAYTEDDQCALHVSMAGGRKTMGYYAGYALSLFARPQDRLSHVLVSAPFENIAGFYYPTRKSYLIEGKEGRVLDAQDAEVTLAEIPFVRLRDEVPERLLAGKSSFKETIQKAQRLNEPDSLVIDTINKQVIAAAEIIELQPILFSFYAWLVERNLRGELGVCVLELAAPNTFLAEEFITIYQRIESEDRDLERTFSGLKNGMEREWFDEKKSRVNKILEDCLGKNLAKGYKITGLGKRGYTRYASVIESEQIEWRE